MGVPVGQADGDHPALLSCGDCGEKFETDETMANGCPFCGAVSYDIEDGGDPSTWRD